MKEIEMDMCIKFDTINKNGWKISKKQYEECVLNSDYYKEMKDKNCLFLFNNPCMKVEEIVAENAIGKIKNLDIDNKKVLVEIFNEDESEKIKEENFIGTSYIGELNDDGTISNLKFKHFTLIPKNNCAY